MMAQTIPYWNIQLGEPEIKEVSAAIRNRNISQGLLTQKLEQSLSKILGVEHVCCTTSGTMALVLAYMAIGLKPGDEIIIPNRTFIATANAARLLGVNVRLVDVLKDRPLIDPEKVESLINNDTKAIVAVHLNGRSANMDDLKKIAQNYDLELVEDTCQALMSKHDGDFIGKKSRFSCFSLGMAKLLTSGQGGFVVCHNVEDYRLLQRIKNQGVMDVTKDEFYNLRAANFKYTDVQAALALAQLSRLGERVRHVQTLYECYRKGLSNAMSLRCIEVDVDRGEVPLRAEFLCKERDRLIALLSERSIIATPQVPDLDRSPHLGDQGSFINSRLYEKHMLTFPSGPDQSLENVDKVIQEVLTIDSCLAEW